MLEIIKKLRIQAMKDKNKPARYAYEVVIAECQTFEAKVVNKKKNVLTEKSFTKILKGEIGKYQEMDGKQYEIELLSVLLPAEKIQLTEDELVKKLSKYEWHKNPKDAMEWLDQVGFEDCYNKGFVAKFVLKR